MKTELRPLKVHATNWDRLNKMTDPLALGWREVMDRMCDLNNALDEVLGDTTDWGGKYATWLDRFGIPSNSDNGWWSRAAIDPDNITAFIEEMTDETEGGFADKCAELRALIYKTSRFGSFTASRSRVRDLITLLDEQGED